MPTEVEALVCDDTRGQFHHGKVTLKDVTAHDVCIKIEHCGICHSDLHTVNGEWAGVNYYPIVPGQEIVGIVESIGDKVRKFKVGDHVGVGAFIDSCRKCDACKNGEEQYCMFMLGTYNSKISDEMAKEKCYPDDMKYTFGGFAQKIVVDENYIMRIPEKLPFNDCAPMMVAGVTVFSPLCFYGAKKGGKNFKVAILGMGGLGDMGAKISKAFGNQVTVFSHSDDKHEYCEKELGVQLVNFGNDEESLERMSTEHFAQFDLVICTFCSKFDIAPFLKLVKHSAFFCMVGSPPEDLMVPAYSLISRRIQLVGSFCGGIKETQEMLDFCAKHKIFPSTEHIKAMDINNAFMKISTHQMEKERFVVDIKDSMMAGDWECDMAPCKKSAKHMVNPDLKIVGAANTAGKMYDPAKDSFEFVE